MSLLPKSSHLPALIHLSQRRTQFLEKLGRASAPTITCQARSLYTITVHYLPNHLLYVMSLHVRFVAAFSAWRICGSPGGARPG